MNRLSVRPRSGTMGWFGGAVVGAVAIAVVAVLMAVSGSATAQNADLVDRGKRLFGGKANCVFCHSWKADGHPSNRSGGGANLHETGLDRAGVLETIQCGRPDTLMPYHDRQAYRDDRCYGLTAAEIGKSKPNRSKRALNKEEMEAIVEFLFAKVVGKPLDLKYCEYYHGVGAKTCNRFRTN